MIGETVTVIRDAASTYEDSHGNAVPGPPAEVDVTGALFNPGGAAEPIEPGRAPVIREPELYFPRQWPDIQPADRVRVRGDDFEVVGQPPDWRSAVGTNLGGLVVSLRRVTG